MIKAGWLVTKDGDKWVKVENQTEELLDLVYARIDYTPRDPLAHILKMMKGTKRETS